VPGVPARPPRWLVATKVVLIGLLVLGAAFPSVGGFEGKGMTFRLPVFALPALLVPVATAVRRRGAAYPTGLDAALTLPFTVDTAANAVGLYDHVDATDDVLHLVNWVLLVAGITLHLERRIADVSAPRVLVWLAGLGVGAVAIIGWEVCEYGVMQWGVAGLDLTYGDTLGDLVLSTVGGGIGAAAALWWSRRPPVERVRAGSG
jgi:hypothetical protein